MSNEIKLVQSPVIQHALVEAGKGVTERLANLNIENIIATIETVKGLKDLRAELNKELTDFESQRKFIKEGVLNPYNEFETVYKSEISDKYKNAIELLKDKIAVVENKIKEDKSENIKSYFVELCLSEDIDFVSFPQVGLEINLSTSEKAYKEKCNEFVTRIADDLRLIDTQNHKAEILVEYKKTLNASKAIKEIQDRKEAERLEAERLKAAENLRRTNIIRGLTLAYHDLTKAYEHVSDPDIFIRHSFVESATKEEFSSAIAEIQAKIKAKEVIEVKTPEQTETPGKTVSAPEPLKAPVVEEKPTTKAETFTATFEVVGTMTQLRALGQYMKDNNITYKNI